MNNAEENNLSGEGTNEKNGSFSLMERLQKENSEQFLTLVRMHLSFVVDINTDDSIDGSGEKQKHFRWGFNKKSKNTQTPGSAAAGSKPSESAPADEGFSKLYELINFLVKDENVKQEGIFRRTGSLSRQQELKQLLTSRGALRLDEGRFSVHDCASVLKGFLSELPQPLLMEQYYATYCTLAAQYPPNDEVSQNRLLTALQLLLLLLSRQHRDFLRRLLALLKLTAEHEASNRMSPDTLATMFTPHLLCPRKLTPEALHCAATGLSPLVSFMIRHATRLFRAPAPLATDIAAYFTLRERRRALSPTGDLDESISDRCAASTIYTFVDRHRTSAENEANPTDTALAQLYAHIQALPDSQQKRRLVKQFNRQNGYGTPIQVQRSGKLAASKSLGESIKRHIFSKGILNKTPKKSSQSGLIDEKHTPLSKDKIKFPCDTGNTEVSHKNVVLKNLAQKMANAECEDTDYETDGSDESTKSEGSLLDPAQKLSPKFISEPNLSTINAKIEEETPKTCKNTRLFRSKGITSRKTNRYAVKKNTGLRSTPTSCVSCLTDDASSSSENDSGNELNVQNRLSRRDSFELRTSKDDSNDSDSNSAKITYVTSTPGVICHNIERQSTPHFTHFRRSSMSPITKSTQKLPKAMQESIMTPRSRKPLIITTEQRENSMIIDANKPDTSQSLENIYDSPKNDSDFISSEESFNQSTSSGEKQSSLESKSVDPVRENVSHTNYSTDDNKEYASCSKDSHGLPVFKTSHEMSPFDLKEYKSKSLTDPFREYLLSRSVLTAAPVDLSLMNKSEDLTDNGITDSLMFCLDGNIPGDLSLQMPADSMTSKENEFGISSTLKTINNYSSETTKMEKSPRKRSANENGCVEEHKGDRKKISLIMKEKGKENVMVETEIEDASPWETDL